MDTAATEPAPTPTAACATVDPTSRIPLRTVSMAARKRGGLCAEEKARARGTNRVEPDAWRISRGPGFGLRAKFSARLLLFSVPTPAADQRTGARAPSPPHARGASRDAPGVAPRGRGASPGARVRARGGARHAQARARGGVARGAPRHRRRAVRPPVQPHLPHAVRPHHGGAHARRALREGRGRATARSIHALRARRPGRRGVPRRGRDRSRGVDVPPRRRTSPRRPPGRDDDAIPRRHPSKRSKRPRRRRGSAGEARPRRRPRGENQSLPNNPPTE